MAKTSDPKSIVKRLKAQQAEKEKGNITYRLTKLVAEQFKKSCDKQGVVPSRVLEEFMKDFIASER